MAEWLVIAALLVLSIPLAGGAFRLKQLTGGAEIRLQSCRDTQLRNRSIPYALFWTVSI